jgi:hypothetical protein
LHQQLHGFGLPFSKALNEAAVSRVIVLGGQAFDVLSPRSSPLVHQHPWLKRSSVTRTGALSWRFDA